MIKLNFWFLIRPLVEVLRPVLYPEPVASTGLADKFKIDHIRKIIKKDFKALTQKKFKKVLLSWRSRRKNLPSINTIIALGLKKVLKPILPYIRKKILEEKLNKPRELPNEFYSMEGGEINEIPATISVVINTKNSPSYFKDILEKYKRQVGFKDKEIIIVDSGSTDDTLNLANYYGCKIIEIKPEEFRHGRSRNIGVEEAAGKYIVNAVSDAKPSALDLLAKVANKLEKNKAAAISVRQIPRSDADIFAAWTVWNHYQAMFGGSLEDVWVENIKNYDSLPAFERRKLAIIDDVFVLHRAEVIKKEKYDENLRYAEDLDLSIRYIKKGRILGFLHSESVIHSHTRPPEYFFKRYFVDTNVIYEVFGSLPQNLGNNLDYKKPADNFFSVVKAANDKLASVGYTNDSWIKEYTGYFNGGQIQNDKIIKLWSRTYNSVSKDFNDFKNRVGTTENNKEISSKIAALVSGIMLSEYFIGYKLHQGVSEEINKFKTLLETGV
ncbi:MAG: hypothetical protein A2113_04005 [Candidatus Woykebacteria bacterium GWA1_44_8]|uniref:Glycosyltransferase 2-like domain-containing protein n=1 Tax=Candidatus Woykebacteria bacterium GWA1_44_8 TaxID=1802591 RepID=A0A1G1W203_9BACT|nr:MAG: hypothetical protein A2113_04005 [Candidatus Woykebacteria bacterium GWA1_44_8]